MKLLKRILSIAGVIGGNIIAAIGQISRIVYGRIKRLPSYVKLVTVYVMVIGILVGLFVWRAQNYYPAIPLGREEPADEAVKDEDEFVTGFDPADLEITDEFASEDGASEDGGSEDGDAERDLDEDSDSETSQPSGEITGEQAESESEGEGEGVDEAEESTETGIGTGTQEESSSDVEGSDEEELRKEKEKEEEQEEEIETDEYIARQQLSQLNMSWPVEGSASNVSVEYGDYLRHETPAGESIRFHTGLQIDSTQEAPVKSVAAGEVVAVNEDDLWFGSIVTIEHEPGIHTVYGNLEEITVEPGEHVQPGEVIGTIGRQGAISETMQKPGLYLELQLGGSPVDPLEYLPK